MTVLRAKNKQKMHVIPYQSSVFPSPNCDNLMQLYKETITGKVKHVNKLNNWATELVNVDQAKQKFHVNYSKQLLICNLYFRAHVVEVRTLLYFSKIKFYILVKNMEHANSYEDVNIKSNKQSIAILKFTLHSPIDNS